MPSVVKPLLVEIQNAAPAETDSIAVPFRYLKVLSVTDPTAVIEIKVSSKDDNGEYFPLTSFSRLERAITEPSFTKLQFRSDKPVDVSLLLSEFDKIVTDYPGSPAGGPVIATVLPEGGQGLRSNFGGSVPAGGNTGLGGWPPNARRVWVSIPPFAVGGVYLQDLTSSGPYPQGLFIGPGESKALEATQNNGGGQGQINFYNPNSVTVAVNILVELNTP